AWPPPPLRVYRQPHPQQPPRRHLAAGDEIEHVPVVPGHHGRTASVDIVGRRLGTELIDPSVVAVNPGDDGFATVGHFERQPSRFVFFSPRLTPHEAAVVHFARAIADRNFTLTIIADVNLD